MNEEGSILPSANDSGLSSEYKVYNILTLIFYFLKYTSTYETTLVNFFKFWYYNKKYLPQPSKLILKSKCSKAKYPKYTA